MALIELQKDLWEIHSSLKDDEYCVITTNGFVKKSNEAVMGRGCAYEATKKFPGIAKRLGELLNSSGNQPYVMPDLKLITFPVTHNWYQDADRGIIINSLLLLKDVMSVYSMKKVYLPRPGVGNGRLSWDSVRPLVEKYFDGDERLVVVYK